MKKAIWFGLVAAALGAVAGPAMTQTGETMDRWNVYPSDWSLKDADFILYVSNAANRKAEIDQAAAAGDSSANTLLCFGYEVGTWGAPDTSAALSACETAAYAGHPRGMRNLGRGREQGWRSPFELGMGMAFDCMSAGIGKPESVTKECYASYEKKYAKKPDRAEAAKWYCKAAEAGNALGMYNCGYAYEFGWIPPSDPATAAKWYKRSAEAGNILGASVYGRFLLGDKGIPGDYAAARGWFQKAIDGGDSDAMANMGYLLEHGLGGGMDRCQAVDFYRRAAELGNLTGMVNYGLSLENGLCGNSDRAAAIKWYEKASAAGSTVADEELRRINTPAYPNYSTEPEYNFPTCRYESIPCRYNPDGSAQWCERQICD